MASLLPVDIAVDDHPIAQTNCAEPAFQAGQYAPGRIAACGKFAYLSEKTSKHLIVMWYFTTSSHMTDSGISSGGTIGRRAIKENGDLTIVQA